MKFPRTIVDAFQKDGDFDDGIFCRFIKAGLETIIHYHDLRSQAGRYANFFRSAGVRPGEVALIILPHTPDLFYAFLGAMLAGAIPSFMPSRTSKQEPQLYWSSHEKLFKRIGSGALLTTNENLAAIRANLPDLGLRLLTIEEAQRVLPQFCRDHVNPDDIALLQHSSGTTGLKKGVALSHAAVVSQVRSYAQALEISRQDQIVSWLPLYHDMGLIACFMLPLITHTPIVMLDPFEWVTNPALLFNAIKDYRATLCWQPNFAFHHLCRTVRPSAQLDLTSMRAWIDCSEPCRSETFDLFAAKFAGAGVKAEQLQVCYAMAEAVFAVTQTHTGQRPRVLSINPERLRVAGRVELVSVDEPNQLVLSAGTPISGLQVRVVDEHSEPLPNLYVGEIVVAGDCLFSGYYKLEDETRRKLRAGWYHTGDTGFIHEGDLYVTGRKNDLIIVHGRNYYAHEIEFIVNQAPGVHAGRNVAVGWFRPEIGSEDVVVIVEFDELERTDGVAVIRDIKEALLTQAGLQVFDVCLVPPGWLVKTTSGKISRIENLNKYIARLSVPQVQTG